MAPTFPLDGPSVRGYVIGNKWNYFHFETLNETSVAVRLGQNSSDDDCDLYVRRGINPTEAEHDYMDIGNSVVSEVTIVDPGHATWFVGVYGYKECSYELNVNVSHACLNNCTSEDNGVCVDGSCKCKGEWFGRDCGSKIIPLLNGEAVNASINKGEWHFYQFQAIRGPKVTVLLAEDNSVGALRLYQSSHKIPTLATYDFVDTTPTASTHRIRTSLTTPANITIGVYGGHRGSHSGSHRVVAFGYGLVVWQAQFGK